MRPAVWLIAAGLGLSACSAPLPLPEAAQAIGFQEAAAERTEAVALRTAFAADSATTEIAGASCEVRQGARRQKIKTPAKLAFAVTPGIQEPITLQCTAVIGAQQQAVTHVVRFDKIAKPQERAYPKTIGVIFR